MERLQKPPLKKKTTNIIYLKVSKAIYQKNNIEKGRMQK